MHGNPVRTHRLAKVCFYGLASVAAVGIIYCIYLLFVPLLAAVLLMFLLDPVVNYFEMKGMKRLAVLICMCLGIISAAAAMVYFIFPLVIAEARHFAGNIPLYKAMLASTLDTLRISIQSRFPQMAVPDFYQVLMDNLPGSKGVKIEAVIAYASSFFSILSAVVIVPVATFLLLLDGHLIQKALLRIVPNKYFEMFYLLFHKIAQAIKFFIRGQLVDASAVGIMTSIGLAIIGLPYALVIGIIAGVGNLIPYLGPIIGFIPAMFVIVVSPEGLTLWMTIKVVIVFVAVQTIEGTFIYPIAVGKSANLHPLAVIIGITIGGQLGGILGMLIAVPAISIAKVSLEVLYANLKSYSVV